MSKVNALIALLNEQELILRDYIVSNNIDEYILRNMEESDFANESLSFKVTIRTFKNRLNKSIFPSGTLDNIFSHSVNIPSSNGIFLDESLVDKNTVSAIEETEYALTASSQVLNNQTNSSQTKATKSKKKEKARNGASSTKKQKMNNWPDKFEYPTHRITSDLLKKLTNINKTFLHEYEYKEVINAIYLHITVDLEILYLDPWQYVEAAKSFTNTYPHLKTAFEKNGENCGNFMHRRKQVNSLKEENLPSEIVEARAKFGTAARKLKQLQNNSQNVPQELNTNDSDQTKE